MRPMHGLDGRHTRQIMHGIGQTCCRIEPANGLPELPEVTRTVHTGR